MEDGYTLAWDENGEVQAEEEVICGIESGGMIDAGPDFHDVCEEVEIQTVESNGDVGQNVMYISNDQVLVMQDHQDGNLMNCEMTEEVIGDQWGELVVGNEEHVGDMGEDTATDDIVIPLPTDQDQYSVERPYPCDFCSRRFRKKATLMNHMVAHQSDKPHGCNLCGVRYAKKYDLMAHLKIHAFVPEQKEVEDDIQDDSDYGKIRKRQKPGFIKKKKMKSKIVTESIGEKGPSSSKSFEYADDDGQMMESLESDFLQREPIQLAEPSDGVQLPGAPGWIFRRDPEVSRYPITDPRKPFVCQHCGVGFAREKAMASHCRIHAGDSPFECRRCGEMFWDPNSMRDHMKTKHSNADDDFIDDDDDEFSDDEDNKFGEFFCSTCGLTFHRPDMLKRHQRVHIKEEFDNDLESGHVCNVCGESFPEALDLLAHAEVHARGNENRCMICGETCSDEQSLAVHVQVKHSKELSPNSCLHCGRSCKDKRTLINHSLEHTKEKSFPCPKCQKTFHNKARLKRHMLSHRNKAVTCEVCGDHFPDGRSLMNHRHSHNSVSGRQFPCRECGKTFGSRSSQQIHIRIHTGERPYGCRFCWKAFADGGTLRKHERIHTGEKPYACAVCPRAFNQRVVLREHIRSHHSGPDPNYSHSITPYCCSVCSDMFSTSQDLIVHLIHHCDLNTAMRRQPHVGPRKYKRRRKLKPYELDLLQNNDNDYDEEVNDNNEMSEPEVEERKLVKRKTRKNSSKSTEEPYTDNLYNNLSNPVESVNNPVVNIKPPKQKKKTKEPLVASRPKMIHTQKTKVAVETNDGGKLRHKTKTLITRTQPTELKSSIGDRIRPRTKNVSYHVLNPEKFPLATFPDDTEQAVNNLLQTEGQEHSPEVNGFSNEAKNKKINNSLGPGRHIIGPGHIVKFVGSGMLVSKKKIKEEMANQEEEHSRQVDLEEEIDEEQQLEENSFEEEVQEETVEEEMIDNTIIIKEEVVDNPLNEFAELSMQHANNFFKCEMCSETFSDRAQLLVHVPIHI